MRLSVSVRRIADQIQTLAKDTLGRLYTDSALGLMMNRSLRTIHALIVDHQPRFFQTSATIALVNGTTEYDLPLDCPPNGIFAVERTSGGQNFELLFVPYRERLLHTTGEFVWSTIHNGRRLRLVVFPVPSSAENLTVRYQRGSVPMQYGAPASIAASTITLAASPTIGETYLETDGPVGASILMSAGDNLGNVRVITAYNVTTRVATVDSPWSTISNLSSMRYNVMPSWLDDQMTDAIMYDSLGEALLRDEENPAPWMERRDSVLSGIVKQVSRLQRAQAGQLTLDRDINRGSRRLIQNDLDIRYRG